MLAEAAAEVAINERREGPDNLEDAVFVGVVEPAWLEAFLNSSGGDMRLLGKLCSLRNKSCSCRVSVPVLAT